MQPAKRRVRYSDDGNNNSSSPQSSSMRYQHQQRSRRASFDQVPSTNQEGIENPNHFTLSGNQQKQQLQLPIYTSNSTDKSADRDISILIAPSSVDSIINGSTKTSNFAFFPTKYSILLSSFMIYILLQPLSSAFLNLP